MKFPQILTLVLLCALVTLAMPALADDVTIDTFAAVQYSYGYFIAAVSAPGPAPLIDAHILVNGGPVDANRVAQTIHGPSNLAHRQPACQYASVVARPGDAVSAVV